MQARFIIKYYEMIYSTIASPVNVFMDYNQSRSSIIPTILMVNDEDQIGNL